MRTTVSTGTTPSGSSWAKNPVPRAWREPDGSWGALSHHLKTGEGFEPLCKHSERHPCAGEFTPFDAEIVDLIELPAGLKPGPYVLGWRWDAEESNQIMASCADVIVDVGQGSATSVHHSHSSASLLSADASFSAVSERATTAPADFTSSNRTCGPSESCELSLPVAVATSMMMVAIVAVWYWSLCRKRCTRQPHKGYVRSERDSDSLESPVPERRAEAGPEAEREAAS